MMGTLNVERIEQKESYSKAICKKDLCTVQKCYSMTDIYIFEPFRRGSSSKS